MGLDTSLKEFLPLTRIQTFFHNFSEPESNIFTDTTAIMSQFSVRVCDRLYVKSRALVMVITGTNAVLQFCKKEVPSARPLWP